MARERCVLCGQSKLNNATRNITFRGVPRDRSTRLKWQEFCLRVYKLPRCTIRLNSTRVCSLHFTEDCFYIRNGLVHTKPHAVPTLYVEPVKRARKKLSKNVPITSSDLYCNELLKTLQTTSMEPVRFSPPSCEKCPKTKECHKCNKIIKPNPMAFEQLENDRIDMENNEPEPRERILSVVDDHEEQLCAYDGESEVCDIDEKVGELTRQIREKSDSLIHFIDSVMKSSTSYHTNENRTSNDGAITDNKPQEREIPLYRVVDYLKKARANATRKTRCNIDEKNLELSKQIKEKSNSLTQYIEAVNRPSTSSDRMVESYCVDQSRAKNSFKLKRDNFNINSDKTRLDGSSTDSIKCMSDSNVAPSKYYDEKLSVSSRQSNEKYDDRSYC